MGEVSALVSLATSVPSYSFDRQRINLESHQIVWCDVARDKSLAEEETPEIDNRLRKIVDYTRFFNDVTECEEYLEDTSETDTFLICFGEVGKILMTRCDQWEIRSMYIICRNDEEYGYWSEQQPVVS